ncbi:MAG: hypothetical protein OEW58_11985 [Gammaproteobacteria bacterium]|nr:hypothetical protein [Gammaproteobacteria bacterium]
MQWNQFWKKNLLTILPVDEIYNGDKTVLEYLHVRAGKILKHGRQSRKEMSLTFGETVRFGFFAKGSHLEQVSLVAKNGAAAKQRAKKYIESEQIYDEKFELKIRMVDQGKKDAKVAIAAVAKQDLDDVIRELDIQEKPYSRLAMYETAIGSLLREVSEVPLVALWSDGEKLVALLVKDGNVLQKKSKALEEQGLLSGMGDDEKQNLIDINALRENIVNTAKVVYGMEAVETICLGKVIDWVSNQASNSDDTIAFLNDLRNGEKLYEKIIGQFRFSAGIDSRVVIEKPELAGLAFVYPQYDFMPEDYHHQVVSYKMAIPALVASVAVSLVLFAVSGMQYVQHKEAMAVYQSTIESQRTKYNQLVLEYPGDKQIKNLASHLDEYKGREQEIRLDVLIGWISSNTPKNVVLTSLKVERKTIKAGGRSSAPEYEPGKYLVAVSARIESTYERSHDQFVNMVTRLGAKGKFESPIMSFEPGEEGAVGKAIFTAVLEVDAKDFLKG